MTRRIENPDRARKPLTLGIRAALLLSLAALVALMTAGALVVGYVERHLAVEECADAVVRGGLDRMEAELDGLLGPVYDRVHTVRDWTMRRTLPLRDPTAMFHTLQPLIESTPIVRGVMFYSNEASFSLRRDDGGWVSRARRLDEDLDVAVAYWDDRGNLIREEHEAPSSAPPTGEPLFREALVRCRARGDQDGAGRVDICWELPGAEGPDAALRLAFAVGPGPRETAVSFELDLARFAEAIVGIHPTPAGYAVALHESGRVLGLTGWRYAAATACPVLEEIAPSGIGRAYAYWASDVNQGTRPFATDAADTTWWCAFRRMSSRKDAPFVFGVAAPQPDLLFAARQGRDYLLLVGLWGMVAAGALAFVLAAAVRRPVRRFVEHVQRYDALEPADNYWPRSRVTEVRSLTDALDELCRQAAARAPAAAVSRTTDVIPDAQLQALFTARKQMRDARARLEDLRARLRGQ
ncbi:MAG TPA: hypothetical protein PKI11_15135, partial [Candidatus Hydrogenedentes bacterium]|nr:hypothetical protein [Candidatus Hydrogenedentota bacterium]